MLARIGSFTSEIGAEISAYNPDTQELFVVSGGEEVQVLDLSDPTNPVEAIPPLDLTELLPGIGGANSIAFSNGLLAIAVESDPATDPGFVIIVEVATFTENRENPDAVRILEVGSLPDMVTFSPDGNKILVANEGEADDGVNPEGSISIIDLSGGFASLTQDSVATADFRGFNGRENDLRGDGVRIFPGTTVAEDVEPEFIAVSPDSQTAFVTLQENNAVAVVDLATATVQDILPLGATDFSQGLPQLTEFTVDNLPQIGTTPEGEEITLGGLSGLWFDGVDEETGNLRFLTVPDRGPVGGNNQLATDGVTTGRQFFVPEFPDQVVTLELNQSTGEVMVTGQIPLTREVDGELVPITGLPNIPGFNETPLDADLNPIAPDPFGSDTEGILRTPNGNLWTVDEQGASIYVYSPEGVLINRFVPHGYAALAGEEAGTFGAETLPEEYLTRRNNRGFEAIAYDSEQEIIYAWIQSPLANPDTDTSVNSDVIRILGINPATGEPVAEYVYLLQAPDSGAVDRIGDAVFAGDGKFFVIERDGGFDSTSQKFLFQIDLQGATNLLDPNAPSLPAGETLESQTADDLAALGIEAVNKVSIANLPSLGYLPSAQPEGLALLPDGSLALLNDNDYGLEEGQERVSLGLIEFSGSNGLDPSDEDGEINIDNFPVFGLRQPDAIASFEAGGQTFYITANEGDSRDEDERIADLTLDPEAFPDAANLQQDEVLGRLEASNLDGDIDGDGDFDQLFAFGSRSFSIWDEAGNLVFDSGDQIAQITAELTPQLFNANDGDPEDFDTRSDNRGAEPEGVTIGVVGDRTYAFIGIERSGGGALVYEVTDPTQPQFIEYIRDDADISTEGITFIPAADSPTEENLVVLANEESDSIAIYSFNPSLRISDIQGAGHVSPFVGEEVTAIPGIVTAVDFNGFYIQDPLPDNNPATSEGIFLFTSSAPSVSVGDEVLVSGTVSEFIPTGTGSGNLSTTQIAFPDIEILSSNNPIPEATVIGLSGRIPPTQITISDDELPVNLQEEAGNFDPEADAIDFYESLEGMRVTVEDAVAVSPTRVFGSFSAEAVTLPNQGAFATPEDILTSRGGINLRSGADNTGDQNPERVQIQFNPTLLPDGFDTPGLNVGDLLGDVTGVLGYSFGNFEVNVTEEFTVTPSNLTQETTELVATDNQLTVASYNILNLEANDEDGSADIANGQFDLLANQIVNNLQTPDIIGLQEVQDNSGSVDDGVLDADLTLQTLVDAIAAAGGPTYEFVTLNPPESGAFGGQPGGNIRNAYLYNSERVDLVEDSLQLLSPEVLVDAGIENPDAFVGSRSPLVAEFEFEGNTVTLINNHFSSRFGSTPVFGAIQPFVQAGEEEREAQSQAINDYVDFLLDENSLTDIIVLGDLNTFEFTNDLAEILPGVGEERVLSNLVTTSIAGESPLVTDDAYTFIFDGNSQVLDHMFVTDSLLNRAEFDIVHVNNDFTRDDNRIRFEDTIVASDHEPLVGRFTFRDSLEGTSARDILIGSIDSDEEIAAGDGNDIVIAGLGDDLILGGEGNDRLRGDFNLPRFLGSLGGNDIILGGAGNDRINGGLGDDRLFGETGDDIIRGNRGNDLLRGGLGDDFLVGGQDSDIFVLAASEGTDIIADFEVTQDLIGLADGLNFSQLAITSEGDSAFISFEEENLAILAGVDANNLNADAFTLV